MKTGHCSPASSEGTLTSMRSGCDFQLERPLPEEPLGVTPSLDQFYNRLGQRYQLIIAILLSANSIPVVVNHLLMAIYAAPTPHNCKPPGNGSREDWLVEDPSFNSNGTRPRYSKCYMYIDPEDHSLGNQTCTNGHEFHLGGPSEWNIVAEWDLVCSRQYLAPLTTTVYFCGVTIGGLIFGALSDRFGRKYLLLTCLYSQCLIGLGLHFVHHLPVFMSLRFFQGIFVQGLQCINYSMIMELVAPKYRTLAGCVIEGFWALGIILLAVIAKFVGHWRYIQLAVNIPTVATVFCIWMVPESIRWLLFKGRVDRAEDIVKKVASCNGIHLDPIWVREELEDIRKSLLAKDASAASGEASGSSSCGIFRRKQIRKHALVLFYIWFTVSLSYYGISYTIPNLSGDRYLNFIIGGGIELAAYLLAFVVLGGFGRRIPLMMYLLLSGLLCISVVSIQTFVPGELVDVEGLSIGLALVGKAAVVSCFCCIFIYTSEVFPTVFRTAGMGTCSFFGRIGSLLAPQFLVLGEVLYKEAPQLVTFLTFGCLSILAAMLSLLLPETLNKNLPDTVEEATHLRDSPVAATSGQDRDDVMIRRRFRAASSLQGQVEGNSSSNPIDEEAIGKGSRASLIVASPGHQVSVVFGTSPEWVEVDGLIVSKNHLVPSEVVAPMASSEGSRCSSSAATAPALATTGHPSRSAGAPMGIPSKVTSTSSSPLSTMSSLGSSSRRTLLSNCAFSTVSSSVPEDHDQFKGQLAVDEDGGSGHRPDGSEEPIPCGRRRHHHHHHHHHRHHHHHNHRQHQVKNGLESLEKDKLEVPSRRRCPPPPPPEDDPYPISETPPYETIPPHPTPPPFVLEAFQGDHSSHRHQDASVTSAEPQMKVDVLGQVPENVKAAYVSIKEPNLYQLFRKQRLLMADDLDETIL